ncbi:unnamed protein product [Lymnaea stagnalis]|uniref:Fucosyltransferase n=1 Tax=Lymnaea stagnalis TaxID=6523 RepID=A0AAV2H322_LYMST
MVKEENRLPRTAHRRESALSRKAIGLLVLITSFVCFFFLATYIGTVPTILSSTVPVKEEVSTVLSRDPDPHPGANTATLTTTKVPEGPRDVSKDNTPAAAVVAPVVNTTSSTTERKSAGTNTKITNETEPSEAGFPANVTVSKNKNISDVISSELRQSADLIGQCDRLPFLACDQTKLNVSVTKQFRVSVLRRPYWLKAFNFQQCDYSNCLFDDSQVTESTDLVIVYVGGLNDNYRPPKRWPHQRYAAAVWESPHHTGASFLYDNHSVWNHAFNLTATYRTDSDIFLPYSRLRFQPRPLKERPNYIEIAQRKKKTAAWFVSNCETPSRRREYVRELQKYIDVDIYGACGQPCSKDNPDCLAQLPRLYMFYLSFENSICTDYVTEKLFKLFEPEMHIVPVVRGGANYDQHLPKNTFVNAANFKTAKDLALHLKKLAGDLKAYSKLLEYKDMYWSDGSQGIDGTACYVCKFLNTKPVESKVYDMKAWMGDNHCREPNDIT